jgi:biotin-(acetyl-CoA carboxylase) ligase
MIAALACVDVAETYGLTAGVKWPNDVQINGRKLAGVIAESITGAGSDKTPASFLPLICTSLGHLTPAVSP